MNTNYTRDDAVELLQQLGLTAYEARCFVVLTRVPKATAKEISDFSEVPRTRVYDAVGVLETQGLVEVQHRNPQQFQAVPVGEALTTLREQYEARFRMLADAILTRSLNATMVMTSRKSGHLPGRPPSRPEPSNSSPTPPTKWFSSSAMRACSPTS